MTIIWRMFPEIWSTTDKIFCHSGPFFALLSPYGPRKSKFWKNKKTPKDITILQMRTINDSYMMYGSWDMECTGQNFLSFWTVFYSFTPLTTRKIKTLKKMKKNTWRHYHFTQGYHKWQSYDVRFLRYQAQWREVFVILDIFALLPPWNNPKNQDFEKNLEKPADIISLHKCTKNHDHMQHCCWDKMHDGCNSYFLLWTIFCPFTH